MKRRDLNPYDLWKTKVRRVGLKKFKLDAPLLFENDFHLAEVSAWHSNLSKETRRMLSKWSELQG